MTIAMYFAVTVVMMVLSALFTEAAEAYACVNQLRLENAADDGDKRAALAYKICARYEEMLPAVQILDKLVNISAAAAATALALRLSSEGGETFAVVLAMIATCLLVIFFGEALPSALAQRRANGTAMNSAVFVWAIMIILWPLMFLLNAILRLFVPKSQQEDEPDVEAFVEELVSIIETVEDEGIIDEERSELLQAALDFSETSASEVMTSRVDMVAIDLASSWDEILETTYSSPYSRLPVYENSIDDIVGVLYLNHFFKAASGTGKTDLRTILLKPCFVYKTMKLPAVLAEMRRGRTQLAIVTDEYGGSMGLVTMEDVFEELVGEIWDETDEIEEEVIEHGENLFELDGDMTIGDFCEVLERDEDFLETESATVGGWTIERLGHFPVEGESFTFADLTVAVLAVEGKRVEKIMVRVGETTK